MSHIDTLKAYDDLIASGIPSDQARVQVEILNKAFEGVLVNKDLIILEKDLKIFFTWELAAVLAAIMVMPWFRKRFGWI